MIDTDLGDVPLVSAYLARTGRTSNQPRLVIFFDGSRTRKRGQGNPAGLGALLPIVNPLGSAPIFLSMTSWAPTEVRQVLASRIAVNAFVLVLASIFFGSYILGLFGISLPIVQIGGGLLVAAAGWRLLSPGAEKLSDGGTAWSAEQVIERAFYPLTFPLTVGPGSISVAITLGANTMHRHMPLWALSARY